MIFTLLRPKVSYPVSLPMSCNKNDPFPIYDFLKIESKLRVFGVPVGIIGVFKVRDLLYPHSYNSVVFGREFRPIGKDQIAFGS